MKRKVCGICGKPGHYRVTCPQGDDYQPTPIAWMKPSKPVKVAKTAKPVKTSTRTIGFTVKERHLVERAAHLLLSSPEDFARAAILIHAAMVVESFRDELTSHRR